MMYLRDRRADEQGQGISVLWLNKLSITEAKCILIINLMFGQLHFEAKQADIYAMTSSGDSKDEIKLS